MKIIFLDFDGVLNSYAYFKSRDLEKDVSEDANALDPKAVARLNRLVEATGASVVISSSWRHGRSLDRLAYMLALRGFVGPVIDKTVDWSEPKERVLETGKHQIIYQGQERGDEIRIWLDAHPEVTAFVALDDDSDMTAVRDQHIQTSYDEGLTDEHVDQAISLLTR